MGNVRFTHGSEEALEVKGESICLQETAYKYYRANVGNPHCVIPVDVLSATLAKSHGWIIENDSRFENRTGVQIMKIIDRSTIQLEIWERGAGYTLASALCVRLVVQS